MNVACNRVKKPPKTDQKKNVCRVIVVQDISSLPWKRIKACGRQLYSKILLLQASVRAGVSKCFQVLPPELFMKDSWLARVRLIILAITEAV